MNRRALILGAMAAPSILRAGVLRASVQKRIAIIGAGAAGLTAAQRLHLAGHDVRVFEARRTWGGRMAELTGFADFPIDTGAEWIHGAPDLLDQIAGRGDLGIKTIEYRPKTYQNWEKGQLRDLPPQDYAETKFYRSTWVGFFRQYILPDIADRITLNVPVRAVDMSGVTLADGRRYDADQVLVTVPLSVLQRGDLQFPMPLADDLQDIRFGQGFKVFLKFRERSYPDLLITGPLDDFIADTWDATTYYDAAFGKGAQDHVLGLFAAGRLPSRSKQAILDDVLTQLDRIYAGAARKQLLGAHVQNWTEEPYIWGSYAMENDTDRDIADILRPIENRIFFAGEALGGANQATVHGAAFSGTAAAKEMG